MRAIAAETKGATDYLPSSVAQFVKNLFVGKFELRCDNETSIMAVAVKVKAKMPDRVVVESTPRHSSASNGFAERAIRIIGEQLRTLRCDTGEHEPNCSVTDCDMYIEWKLSSTGSLLHVYGGKVGGCLLCCLYTSTGNLCSCFFFFGGG